MKIIRTEGKYQFNVFVDDEDFDKVNVYRWVIAGDGYARVSIGGNYIN